MVQRNYEFKARAQMTFSFGKLAQERANAFRVRISSRGAEGSPVSLETRVHARIEENSFNRIQLMV
jgi:hypothetical protein